MIAIYMISKFSKIPGAAGFLQSTETVFPHEG